MKLPSWRIDKLAQQAGKFEPKNLRRIISEMAEIDIRAKTSDNNLRDMLDLLIIKDKTNNAKNYEYS